VSNVSTRVFKQMSTDMDAFYRRQGAHAHADTRHAEIAMLCRGSRVLDIGCGTGDLLLILQAQHPQWKLYGTDISAVALDMARQCGLHARLQCQSDVPVGRFDTVILSQVLEHLDAVTGQWLMEQAARVAPFIVVSVPNNNAVKSPYHIRTFTSGDLLKWLSFYGRAKLHRWSGSRKRLIATVKRNR